MPKKLLCVLSAVMLVSASLFSCSETSEPSSLLREHELDALISRAENSEPPMPSAGESQESVRLSFELTDGERGITAVADAEIVLPQTALSVYGVRRRSFTQETVDMLRYELLGDARLYDGGALEVPTRDDLALRIGMLERELDECTDSARREYLTEELAECRVACESAPSAVIVTPYPSDGKLASPSARLASGELAEYYRWSASMNPDGEVLYAVTDGSEGYYSVLYVQNCTSYGSKLVYRKNRVSWESHEGVLSVETSFETTDKYESFPENFLSDGRVYDSEPSLACATGETVELSENEARERAERLLSALGFEGFAFREGGLYSEPLRLDRESGDYYGTYYILRYMRCIDGVMLTQPSGTKTNVGRENGVDKKVWSPECIELRINDDGVVGLDIYSPLEITETLVERASLESVGTVCESVEKLLTIAAASEFYEKSIKIDSVTLRYSRISEADSFDEGMLVPVWDISGLCEYSSAGYVFRRVYESVMVINAVDGTVIVDGS